MMSVPARPNSGRISRENYCFLSLLFHWHCCFCLSCLHPTFLLGYFPRYFLFYELTPGFTEAYAIISLTEFYHKTCHTSFHLALFGPDQRSAHFFFSLQRLSKYIGLCEPHRFCHTCVALLFWHKSHLRQHANEKKRLRSCGTGMGPDLSHHS